MWSLFVVPEEAGGKFLLEEVKIGEESIPMVVGKLFLDGTIKSFYVCIHTGALWIGVEVGDILLFNVCPEVFFKLRAIICLYVQNSKREYLLEFFEEILR